MTDFPVFSRFEYLKKLVDWANVYRESNIYPTQVPIPAETTKEMKRLILQQEFDPHWELILKWTATLELPERGTAEDYCFAISNYAGSECGSDFIKSWRYISLRVRKSNCLGRLLYDGEALRKTPCQTHNGHWCWPEGLDCCDGTGWYKNPNLTTAGRGAV